MLQKEIESRLAEYRDPYLDIDLMTAKVIKRIAVEQDRILIDIVLGYPHVGIYNELIIKLKQWLAPVISGKTLDITVTSRIDVHTGKQGMPSLPQVKNIIAVASGKGGVGKSTIAVNLALALAKEGAQAGILDADIYGPSQPTMLGTVGERPALTGKSLAPVKRHGIQSMSIGYLIDETAAMVWRGPMIGKAMQQLLHDTQWEALDYLVVDLPPGTGDIQLTLCQKIPVSGAVIVTTPQDLALSDVRRACEMFNKLNVPILGVVENMSGYHCPQCGHEDNIFGEGGAIKLSQQYGLAMLGAVPLHIRIRELTDSGHPPVAYAPESGEASVFYLIARKVAATLSLQVKDYSAKFPKVVVYPAVNGAEHK